LKAFTHFFARGFIPALFMLLLMVTPVSAQATTPPDALDRVEQFISDVGAPFALIFFIVFVVYRLAKPGADAFVENSRARTQSEELNRDVMKAQLQAQQENAEHQQRLAEVLNALTEVNKRQVTRMEALETRDQAEKGRETAVESITQKVEAEHGTTREGVQTEHDKTRELVKDGDTKTLNELKAISERMDTLITQDKLDGALRPLKESLDRVVKELEKKRDTDELTPAPATPEQKED
jgi:hypothetical protein